MDSDDYRRYLKGDNDGMTAIVNTYRSGLLLYVNSYVKNMDIAEDLVEDTFFRIMIKRPLFFEKRSFKTWLYTIARHIAIDHLRRSKHEQITPIESIQNMKDTVSVEKNYLAEERKIMVHHALYQIKTDYRQAIYLSYFEEFNHEQIARIMGKSKRQVEMLIYRGKQALKRKLIEEGFQYEI